MDQTCSLKCALSFDTKYSSDILIYHWENSIRMKIKHHQNNAHLNANAVILFCQFFAYKKINHQSKLEIGEDLMNSLVNNHFDIESMSRIRKMTIGIWQYNLHQVPLSVDFNPAIHGKSM